MSGVIRTGGVIRGGTQIGVDGASTPSPAGTWAPQFNDQIVDFDRDAFTRLLAGKGYDITWEKATLCPNRPSGGLAPKDHALNCQVCDNGLGFVYYDSIPTKMLITGVRLDQSYFAHGRWDPGQVMVTSLPEFRINWWDRLTLCNGIARFYELVRRQPNTLTDQLKYEALHVSHLSWVDRSGALACFEDGVQFRLDAEGRILWLTDTGIPDDNVYYSVAYEYRPRYVVQALMHQHRESTVQEKHYEFPVQALAKLDFLIRDESTDAAQTEDVDPFPR